MPYEVPIDVARKNFPSYTFVSRLTASEQKCAFHARDKDGTDLCFKIIKPGCDPMRVEREILAMQAVSHPNVVKLRQYHTPTATSPHHFTIEEFVKGDDLSPSLAGKPWSLSRTAKFFAQVFDGLGALQDAALVHRDLKPSNIRVTPDGRPVIIDFGLVRHLDLPDVTKTVEGAAIGTPLYFAPEQFTGTKYDIDHRTDYFAAGVLMHMALLGRHPFDSSGLDFDSLKNAVCADNSFAAAPDFSKLEQRMRLLLTKLLQKQRLNRPAEAKTVAKLLRNLGK
jgi:serine/threonine protein kinase